MARALIRANAHLSGHARGDEWEVELTDREVKRAAGGQISIVRTWDLDRGESLLAGRVRAGTIAEVLDLVDSGGFPVGEVLAAEQAGRNRVGAVNELQERAQVAQEAAQAAADPGAGVVGSDDGPEAAEGR